MVIACLEGELLTVRCVSARVTPCWAASLDERPKLQHGQTTPKLTQHSLLKIFSDRLWVPQIQQQVLRAHDTQFSSESDDNGSHTPASLRRTMRDFPEPLGPISSKKVDNDRFKSMKNDSRAESSVGIKMPANGDELGGHAGELSTNRDQCTHLADT
jgi:hypothetical protein